MPSNMEVTLSTDAAPPRKRGRPAKFDRATAVAAAMRLFWEYGYDAVSYEDLSREMGIGPGSLVNSFGSKDKLFREALNAYHEGPGSFLRRMLEEIPIARKAFHRMLLHFAEQATHDELPKGCLVSLGGFDQSGGQAEVRQLLKESRSWNERLMYARLERARLEGDIPADSDTENLASYYAAILRGMAGLSKDGNSAETLASVANLAMKAWPGA